MKQIKLEVNSAPLLAAARQENRSWTKRLGDWGTYAAAAGTALAMSTNASADIIYSGVQDVAATLIHESNVNTLQTAVFAVAGVMERANVVHDRSLNGGFGFAQIGATNPAHRLLFATTGVGQAKLYTLGQPILGGHDPNALLRSHTPIGAINGQWGPGTVTGFAGFKSAPTGDLGWIRVKVFDRNSDAYPDEVEIIDSAYNNVPGAAIYAGQGIPSPVPEPSGTAALSLLGAGAAGLLAWRRRRAEKPAK
jgi:hypothetical protein